MVLLFNLNRLTSLKGETAMISQLSLSCIQCQAIISIQDDQGKCPNCGAGYPVLNGKTILCNGDEDITNNNWLDRAKLFVKRYPLLYRIAVIIFSPVYISRVQINKHFKIYIPKDGLILNVGSGNTRISKNFINLDCYPYENVDVVCDACNLPFPSNSVDAIINIAILEHVNKPEKAISEMHRILKVGGIIYTIVPFIQGFHASPHDYYRWTLPGVKMLHGEFEECESGVRGGPTSAMLWVLQEWLAMVLSLGFKPIYKAVFILSMIILWPVKFIDVVLSYHSMSPVIACAFYYIGKKK